MAGRRPKKPEPGEGKDVFVPLPDDLTLDLYAFCEAHFGASQTRVICEALRRFIEAQLQAEPTTRQRFNEAKALAQKPAGEVVKLVNGVLRPSEATPKR